MIDESDLGTSAGLRELVRLTSDRAARIVIWAGAGVSKWNGYPLWDELADRVDGEFRRECPTYSVKGLPQNSSDQAVEIFSQACACDSHRYNRALVAALHPREPSAVFRRFVRSLELIAPAAILTTNVDESLERAFPDAIVLERSNLERARAGETSQRLVIAKLHGSLRAIESLVFTQHDYARLAADGTYLRALSAMIDDSIILFVGYSVRDGYLLDLLMAREGERPLLGDGPHFAFLPRGGGAPRMQQVRVLRYVPSPNADHRGALQFLEEVARARKPRSDSGRIVVQSFESSPPDDSKDDQRPSAHLLADVFPPGTWRTSDDLTITGENGESRRLVAGPGYSPDEVMGARPMAHHDIAVGLLCFDHLYASIDAVQRLHTALGSEGFWTLAENGILQLFQPQQHLGVLFPRMEQIGGSLEVFTAFNEDQEERTPVELLRRQIIPSPGNERRATALLENLGRRTRVLSALDPSESPEWTALALARSLLLRPTIRRMIGISDGAPLDRIGQWNMHPILRVGHVASTATIAHKLRIDSVRFHFGAEELARPAFGEIVTQTAEENGALGSAVASYVTHGRFGADVGRWLADTPGALVAILRFRDSMEGLSLRDEIRRRLRRDRGADVNVLVEQVLEAALPVRFLQAARDRFDTIATSVAQHRAVAVWDQPTTGGSALRAWRRRARSTFVAWLKTHGMDAYTACPCGSGEKAKFCCAAIEE